MKSAYLQSRDLHASLSDMRDGALIASFFCGTGNYDHIRYNSVGLLEPNLHFAMSRTAQTGRRHNALENDLLATGPLKNKAPKRKSRHEEDGGEKFVDAKASRKILRIGQELAAEDEQEQGSGVAKNTAFDFESRLEEDDLSDDAGQDVAEDWGDEDEIVEEIELDPEDLETYSKFFPTQEDPLLRQGWGGEADDDEGGESTNLADLILEKIAAHEASQGGRGDAQFMNGAVPDEDFELPPKVVEVYTK